MAYVKFKDEPTQEDRRDAFHVVANWFYEADEDGHYYLPHDDHVRVVIRQLYEIIAQDDERGPEAWNAICTLCNEYEMVEFVEDPPLIAAE